MTQMTLDGSDTRFRVLAMRWDGLGPCFGAKCTACGAWLTKWDFSEDDASSCAAHALDYPGHFQHLCPA